MGGRANATLQPRPVGAFAVRTGLTDPSSGEKMLAAYGDFRRDGTSKGPDRDHFFPGGDHVLRT
jgi:hypothetical protein